MTSALRFFRRYCLLYDTYFYARGAMLPQVAELIAGLQDIGCTRTTGEDQTVCVISNSFNAEGTAPSLQASGDLPAVEILKVRRTIRFVVCLGPTI